MGEMLMGRAVLVRAMQVGDLDRVVAIAERLEAAPQWPRRAYEEMLDPGSGRLGLVAEAGAAMVGFVVVRLMAPEAELESIAVASEAQRRGVGGVLMEAVLRELAEAGIAVVFLEVRASNEAARGIYGRFGFCESGRRRNYYSAPVEDAVLMQLTLG